MQLFNLVDKTDKPISKKIHFFKVIITVVEGQKINWKGEVKNIYQQKSSVFIS